jgi:hypothetical protein
MLLPGFKLISIVNNEIVAFNTTIYCRYKLCDRPSISSDSIICAQVITDDIITLFSTFSELSDDSNE